MELYYFSSGPRERVLQAILDAKHHVCAVFVTDPVRWPKVKATMELAEHYRIPCRIIGRHDLEGLVETVKGQVCLSVGFGYVFPEAFVHAVKLGLNVHGSLLPRYAGARTLNWVVESGDSESGVTVHQMDAGVDTGPILLQKRFPLSRFDTGASLYRKTLEFEPQVVVEALAQWESGKAALMPQARGEGTVHPNRVPEHSEVDPTRSLLDLYDKIRAADPERYPAHFYVDGQKVCIKLWRPDKPPDEPDLV